MQSVTLIAPIAENTVSSSSNEENIINIYQIELGFIIEYEDESIADTNI